MTQNALKGFFAVAFVAPILDLKSMRCVTASKMDTKGHLSV